MGLDMYLYRKIYLYEIENCDILNKQYKVNGKKLKFNEYDTITTEIAYWRKANAIHSWIVKNCCDGEDDCRTHFIPYNRIKELLCICKKVKKNKNSAEEFLPTQSGFFFGSTDYDEYYFEDIDLTIKQLQKILKEYKNDFGFYYEASW